MNVTVIGKELSIDSLKLIAGEGYHREICQGTKDVLMDISNVLVVNEQIMQIDESNEGILVDDLHVVVAHNQSVQVGETAEGISLNRGNSISLQCQSSQISRNFQILQLFSDASNQFLRPIN